MHDLIIVGGGIAGASLALAMARAGASVLMLEREAQCRDRIRGEGLHVWSHVDAGALGIRTILLERCAHEIPFITHYKDEVVSGQRDLRDVRPPGNSEIAFFHPAMQETLIEAASW